MKKIVLVFGFTVLLLLVSACGNKVEPLDNPQSELFTVIAVFKTDGDEEYIIYERTNIDESMYQNLPAVDVGKDGDTCILSGYHSYNYMIKYDGNFYDIIDADKLNLYTCDVLESVGVIE